MPFPPYAPDEPLICAVRADGLPRLELRQVAEPCAVLGRSSEASRELHLERCRADDLPVLRRRGGGCTVILDPGNLVLSAVLPVPGFGQIPKLWRQLNAWLLASLERAGVGGLRCAGISDLALGDRKLGGASMHRARDLVYYTTTLLVDPRIELMERYLPHPPREPDYRRGRTHRDFVGSLAELADIESPAALRQALLPHLSPPRQLQSATTTRSG